MGVGGGGAPHAEKAHVSTYHYRPSEWAGKICWVEECTVPEFCEIESVGALNDLTWLCSFVSC